MKSIFFHMQGYRDLPDDFAARFESVCVTPPSEELCDPRTAGRDFRWNIAELEFADELGFDGLGVNEHHQNAYGYCASPTMIASSLAKRESDAAIVVLGSTMPNYNPPTRVAEEYAILDCLSNGRLVAGMPVGSPMDNVSCYGTPPTMVRPKYYEAHDLVKQAWTRQGPFAFNGRFTKLRYVNVWPKPIQKPHPPIWLAGGGSVETWQFAVENNYTYNYLSFGGHTAAKVMMDGYWAEVEKAGLDDNPYRAGCAQLVVVADTDAEAERLYLRHIQNFYAKALHVGPRFAQVPGIQTLRSFRHGIANKSGYANRERGNSNPYAETWADFTDHTKRVIGGSPDTVVAGIEELARNLRVGHIMLLMQIQSMHHDLTRHSMKLFAEKVLPRIRGIWHDQGYVDHWWPQGAAQGPRRLAGAMPVAAE